MKPSATDIISASTHSRLNTTRRRITRTIDPNGGDALKAAWRRTIPPAAHHRYKQKRHLSGARRSSSVFQTGRKASDEYVSSRRRLHANYTPPSSINVNVQIRAFPSFGRVIHPSRKRPRRRVRSGVYCAMGGKRPS